MRVCSICQCGDFQEEKVEEYKEYPELPVGVWRHRREDICVKALLEKIDYVRRAVKRINGMQFVEIRALVKRILARLEK